MNCYSRGAASTAHISVHSCFNIVLYTQIRELSACLTDAFCRHINTNNRHKKVYSATVTKIGITWVHYRDGVNKYLSCCRETALQGGSVLGGWWVMAWVGQYYAPNRVGARKLKALIFYSLHDKSTFIRKMDTVRF